jgi:RHS repeat-associated protein
VESVAGPSDIVRQTAYTYDLNSASATGLLKSEIVEPNNATCNGAGHAIACKLETDYLYDAYGNRVSAATTGLGAILSGGTQILGSTTRTTTSSYYNATNDPHAQYAVTVTNAADESESWVRNATFGLPLSHTGPNGLATIWTYDIFGRKTREHRPDSTETQFAYFYCAGINGGTATCPTNATMFVTATPTKANNGGQIGPQTVTYYDALYRVIVTDVQGFGGQWIRAATQYDAFGRVSQTSRPYFRDTGTPYWTVNTSFDPLGRVTTVTRPDGGYTTYVFDGLTDSATVHIVGGSVASETTTTAKNARGLVAAVTDAMNKIILYQYDAVGNLTNVTDSATNQTVNTYDVRGNKITAADPDMGNWTYQYDAFGALYIQTDAKAQQTVMSYDALGRAVERSEAGAVSGFWVYGTSPASDNVDKLVEACGSANCRSGTDYIRTHAYDGTGRPQTVTITAPAGGASGAYTLTYDTPTGRVATLKYPSGLKVQYNYDATLGYLLSITDFTSGTAYWTATARDAELHLTGAVAGNGVATYQLYNPANGFVEQIRASADGQDDGSLANFSYAFDSNGTLMSRTDPLAGGNPYTETFCYDALNRLVGAGLGGLGNTSCTTGRVTKSVTYDEVGNITRKSDLAVGGSGSYSYPAPGGGAGSHPHAVTGIAGTVLGVVDPQYSYDADGNMLCEYVGTGCVVSGREIDAWTAFNKVKSVSEGSTTVALGYDSEHARITQKLSVGSAVTATTYFDDPMSGAMAEQVVSGGVVSWHDYLTADGKIVAEHFKTGASQSWNYFLLDHLGSVSVVTDQNHNVAGRLSYDAWGRMRNADGSDDTSCALPQSAPTTRGFTSQEEIPAICLLNYNARLYDPTIAKFLSPDGIVQNPYDMQMLNRYSYVGNNPLSDTDPTGNIGVSETVLVTGFYDPAILPLALVATVAELAADVAGLGGLFGAAPTPAGVVTTAAAPTPAANAGNPTGLTAPQNTALPGTTNVSNIVPTSNVCASSSAAQTAAAKINRTRKLARGSVWGNRAPAHVVSLEREANVTFGAVPGTFAWPCAVAPDHLPTPRGRSARRVARVIGRCVQCIGRPPRSCDVHRLIRPPSRDWRTPPGKRRVACLCDLRQTHAGMVPNFMVLHLPPRVVETFLVDQNLYKDFRQRDRPHRHSGAKP